MDDVQRVFTLLVDVLTETDPTRLRAPLEVAEIYQTILPYRKYRSQLAFETNQDYEMAILRLLAGEGGFASVDPAEVQNALAEETRAVNPNPGAFREYAAARVFLNATAVDGMASSPDAYAPPPPPEPYAPPEPTTPPETPVQPTVEETVLPPEALTSAPTLPFTPVEPAEAPSPNAPSPPAPGGLDGVTTFDDRPELRDPGPTSCPSCTRMLPRRGELRFCPYCGMDVTTPSCRFCGTDLDPDWAFCIACGRHKSPDS